jgi:membrane protease YdiL (CAAX protease family)
MTGLGLIIYNILIYCILSDKQSGLNISDLEPGQLFQILGYRGVLLIQILSHLLILLTPAAIFVGLNYDRLSIKQSLKLSVPQLILSLGVLIASTPVVALLSKLNLLIPLPKPLIQAEESIMSLLKEMANPQSLVDKIILFTTLAVVPAISEEFMFRGALQKLIRSWNYANWIVIFISAFIFSSFHFQFEGFLPRFFLGIILGYAFSLSNSLAYPVFMHFSFNAIQVIYLIVYGPDTLTPINPNKDIGIQDFMLAISGMAIMSVLFYYWTKLQSNE